MLDDPIFKPEFERAIEILKVKFNAEMPDRTIDGAENPDILWEPRREADYLLYLESEDFSKIRLNVIVKTESESLQDWKTVEYIFSATSDDPYKPFYATSKRYQKGAHVQLSDWLQKDVLPALYDRIAELKKNPYFRVFGKIEANIYEDGCEPYRSASSLASLIRGCAFSIRKFGLPDKLALKRFNVLLKGSGKMSISGFALLLTGNHRYFRSPDSWAVYPRFCASHYSGMGRRALGIVETAIQDAKELVEVIIKDIILSEEEEDVLFDDFENLKARVWNTIPPSTLHEALKKPGELGTLVRWSNLAVKSIADAVDLVNSELYMIGNTYSEQTRDSFLGIMRIFEGHRRISPAQIAIECRRTIEFFIRSLEPSTKPSKLKNGLTKYVKVLVTALKSKSLQKTEEKSISALLKSIEASVDLLMSGEKATSQIVHKYLLKQHWNIMKLVVIETIILMAHILGLRRIAEESNI